MKAQTEQWAPGEAVSPVTEPGARSGRRRHLRVSLAIMAAAACAGFVIVPATFTLRGTPALRAAFPGNTSNPTTRLETAVHWVDGLATGLISPRDVTSRLLGQDPEMARAVMAAWSDLKSVGGFSLSL